LAEECGGNTDGLKQRYLFSALFSAGVMVPSGFEFSMRKPLHVVHTTPDDWMESGPDLRNYVTRVNAIKRDNRVFQEEGPVTFVPCHNPNVLLMRKRSSRHGDEALLILNKDVWHHQEFYSDHLRHFLPEGVPLRDISPEYPLEHVLEPFHYALRPGQGIVLVASRG